MSRAYLLVIGNAAALAWVLSAQRMAFPASRRSQASALEKGDELLLYTTRGCFNNPTRHLGRVMGVARVTNTVHDLPEPVSFADRTYPLGCELKVHAVAPLHQGVELRTLVPELHAFPDTASWSVRLRRPLVPLDSHDTAMLKDQLAALLRPLDRELGSYVEAANKRRHGPAREL